MEPGLIERGAPEEDRRLDLALRPRALGEFVGQERTKKILGMSIEAARGRAEVLDHVLLAGPPGLGKTSLAHIIARELGVNVHVTSGPAIERAADLAAIVNNLEEHDVLFIDEIHRLQRPIEDTPCESSMGTTTLKGEVDSKGFAIFLPGRLAGTPRC